MMDCCVHNVLSISLPEVQYQFEVQIKFEMEQSDWSCPTSVSAKLFLHSFTSSYFEAQANCAVFMLCKFIAASILLSLQELLRPIDLSFRSFFNFVTAVKVSQFCYIMQLSTLAYPSLDSSVGRAVDCSVCSNP